LYILQTQWAQAQLAQAQLQQQQKQAHAHAHAHAQIQAHAQMQAQMQAQAQAQAQAQMQAQMHAQAKHMDSKYPLSLPSSTVPTPSSSTPSSFFVTTFQDPHTGAKNGFQHFAAHPQYENETPDQRRWKTEYPKEEAMSQQSMQLHQQRVMKQKMEDDHRKRIVLWGNTQSALQATAPSTKPAGAENWLSGATIGLPGAISSLPADHGVQGLLHFKNAPAPPTTSTTSFPSATTNAKSATATQAPYLSLFS